ncbi:MAG: CRTAC1 family protein, partial [Ardenticatenaceae bacterium]
VPTTVEAVALAAPARACTGGFVTHELDHTTTVPGGDQVQMFAANGSGVAINDLDNDRDLDVVLANHAGANTILWNQGGLAFRTERMPHGDSRSVNIVDVDGDGWLDLIFTRRASGPNYWRNSGSQHFTLDLLPGINKPLYAINWGDLDGDGDVDLVGGSYDAGLLADFGQSFLLGGEGGVYYYENRGDRYAPMRLASAAQALAIALFDMNGDERPDILVGNDFAVPDQGWVRQGESWVEATLFSTTSHSTMSFDSGDIDNDGREELFATDMKPYSDDPETMAAWQPLMAEMDHPPLEGDPQIMANVLQVRDSEGVFRDEAGTRGIDATGWSWSGKFGDLDNDGFLDLYVVNGMIEAEMFAHLPHHELVEQNQTLRNDGQGSFVPAREWQLGSRQSGRGMSMADLDQDGDLDIVVNNLRGAAQLFENRPCGGHSLQVDLFWPESKNTRALGARLTLHTSTGTYYRHVAAASGYLSGDPARIHFGLPAEAELQALDVQWPDGRLSKVEPLPQGLLSVTR